MNKPVMTERLRKLRENRTQEEVAKAVGITAAAYSMYETGDRVPRDDVKIRLAEYYGRSVKYIFFSD